MLASTLTLLGACTSSQLAQSGEYDDMYFNSADRRKIQYTDNSSASTNYASRNSQRNATQNDTYYQGNNASVEQQTATADAEQDAYYDENYDGSRNVPSPAAVTNNYYGNSIQTPSVGWVNSGFGFYNDPFFYADPYMFNPYAVRRSFYAVNPGLAFGFGWNNWNAGFGWGMYDPFYSPYGFYSPYAYRPWGMGMYDPYWGPWGHNNYMAGYYNGYYDAGRYGAAHVRTVSAPRSNRSSMLMGNGNAVNQGTVLTGGRTTGRAINGNESTMSTPSNGRSNNNLAPMDANSTRPSRGGAVANPNNIERNMAAEPAETRRAREVEIIRPERPARTAIDNRPARASEEYVRPGSNRPAVIERANRPTREEYYSRPSRNVAPAREQSAPTYSAPNRQSAPMMQQRSAPSRYEAPSRPSRDYSAPSRSSGSYSTPAPSMPSYSAPSRGSSSPAPSGGRPSRGGGY